MNFQPIQDAIIEQCSGIAASTLRSVPRGLVRDGDYRGLNPAALAKFVQSSPRFQVIPEDETDVPALYEMGSVGLATLRRRVITTWDFERDAMVNDGVRALLMGAVETCARSIRDALLTQGAIASTIDGRQTLVLSGCASKCLSSKLESIEPASGTIRWAQVFEMIAQSPASDEQAFVVQDLSAANYYTATAEFSRLTTGTRKLVFYPTTTIASSDFTQRFLVSMMDASYHGWAIGWGEGAGRIGLSMRVIVSGAEVISDGWLWTDECLNQPVVLYFTCDGTYLKAYTAGVEAGYRVALGGTPTEALAGTVMLFGRNLAAPQSPFSEGGIVYFETTPTVLSASEIAADAARTQACYPSRARFEALSGSVARFDARDAAGASWADRSGTYTMTRTGSPNWLPL